jgi:hypothetical protein
MEQFSSSKANFALLVKKLANHNCRSKERNVFASSNTGILDSNPTRGRDVCFNSVFVCSCAGSGLQTGWSPVQGILPTVLSFGAVPYLRRLVSGFDSRSGHARFVVDKVALGHVFSEYFSFPCQFSYHEIVHTHLSSGTGTIGQLVAEVPSGISLTLP